MANEKKKLQKAALGLQDSDDEDIEGDIDQQIETMLAPKRIVKEVKACTVGLPNLTGLSNCFCIFILQSSVKLNVLLIFNHRYVIIFVYVFI